MKKFISLFLLVFTLISVCLLAGGCAANGNNSDSAIVGTWNTTIDLAPTLLKELGTETEDFTKYLELDSFDLSFTFCLNEDNTYKLSVDEESFKKSTEDFLEAVTNAMVKYLEEMFKETGSGLTIEDYEKEIGMPIEDYITASLSESVNLNIDTDTGKYSLSGTELTIGEDEVITIKLTENTLTFTDYSGPDSETFMLLKDVTWKRG